MNKEILRLTIPNILSNVSVPLLSTVDTVLMGRLSVTHLGAIGLGAMIFNFVYWNFGFLRMGTTGMTAQAFGSVNRTGQVRTLYRSLALAGLISFLLILFGSPLTDLAIDLMKTSADQADFVRRYIRIRLWAAPATLGLYVLFGWFFGLQNSVIPLVITLVINLINIVLSYIFVLRFGYEIRGVAYGTVIAQYFGFILAMLFVVWRYKDLFGRSSSSFLWSVDWSEWIGFLRIHRDIFLRTLCLTLVFVFFYRRSSMGGASILAINIILMQLINWMSYGIDGFAYAAESLTGKYYGARDRHRMDMVIRYIFYWSVAFAIFYSGFYGLFDKQIFGLFTKDEQIVDLAHQYRYWMVLLPLVGFASYIWDGIFIGITASRAMRNSMFFSLIIFAGAFYFSSEVMDVVSSLWLSLSLFLFARAMIQWWMFRKSYWDLD